MENSASAIVAANAFVLHGRVYQSRDFCCHCSPPSLQLSFSFPLPRATFAGKTDGVSTHGNKMSETTEGEICKESLRTAAEIIKVLKFIKFETSAPSNWVRAMP